VDVGVTAGAEMGKNAPASQNVNAVAINKSTKKQNSKKVLFFN